MINAAAAIVRNLSGNIQEIQLWPGTRFLVDLRDRVHRQMWFASYEQHVTKALNAVLQDGDTFLDVGAHIGYHSVFAAGVVGPEGHVFSFEPDPIVNVQLAKNLSFFPNAQALPYAVSDRQAETVFERSWNPQESGWGALTSVRDFEKGEHIQVHTVALDSWCEKTGTKNIRAAKIDAEGSEIAVLRGAQRVLQSLRPVLCMEVNEVLLKQAGGSGQVLLNILSADRYCVYELSFQELRQFRGAVPEFADCLCIPEELEGEMLEQLGDRGFRKC